MCGVAACAFAVVTIRAASFSFGADPVIMAKATSSDPLRRDQGVVDSMAVSVKKAEQIMEVKANWLNLALGAGVLGIVFLAVFAAMGGVE